jgi:hypothetical protein
MLSLVAGAMLMTIQIADPWYVLALVLILMGVRDI